MEKVIEPYLIALAITCLPAFVAYRRKHKNKLAVIVLNAICAIPVFAAVRFPVLSIFAFGLIVPAIIVVPWIVAMVWACTNNVEP